MESEGIDGLTLRLKRRVLNFKLFQVLLQKFGKKYAVSAYSVLMTKNWLDATFRFCITGAYGHFLSNYLAKQVSSFIFFDIGANQGLYTLIASQNPNCSKVVAFEPVSSTFNLLEKNIEINQAIDKVLTVKKGLGEKDQFMEIKIPINHSGAATTSNHYVGAGNEYTIEKIEIVSHDYLNELKISRHETIICKINVEGNEKSVINAMAKSNIFNKVKSIFYEIDEKWVDPKDIEYLLKDLGFDVFEKIGAGKHYDVLASRVLRSENFF